MCKEDLFPGRQSRRKDFVTDRKLPVCVVMLGATGAVGGEVVRALLQGDRLERLLLLGRRQYVGASSAVMSQAGADIFDVDSYRHLLPGHDVAICTLGVGQPTATPRETFLAVDRDAVLEFAKACKAAGVRHFLLLGSVGASARSPSYYLRSKGELEDGLRGLGFERLSLFRPSMILTPTNRYGVLQGITLMVWPWLSPLLVGPLRKYRGIPVARLGRAIAATVFTSGAGIEVLEWDEIRAASGSD